MIDVGSELAKHFDAAALGRERVRFDGAELPLVAPDSIQGFVEAVRFAAREKLALVPIGLGSKLGWIRAPEHADFLLSTRRYAGVVSHVPDDGTISVRAGTRMSELREITRRGGHFLTPDVPHPSTKTIGGVIAAGESGADRLRFGPVRHHVLGLKVVLADGSVSKCGGQLVKNVTGFDLMRLYTGSHGTLCVIVEASLRLFPEPEHELWITAEVPNAEPRYSWAARALALPIRMVSLSLVERGKASNPAKALTARLFGRHESIAADCDRLCAAWSNSQVLEGDEARRSSDELRDSLGSSGDARATLSATCAPSAALGVEADTFYDCDDNGIDCRTLVQPGVATLEFELAAVEPARLRHAARLARQALGDDGSTLALRNAPAAALEDFEPVGDFAGLDLMRAIKSQLDPHGVFARGRLHREL